MALADRLTSVFGGSSMIKRTLFYVAGFGLASLLVVWLLGLGVVSLAEGLLPRAGTTATASGSAGLAPSSGPRASKPTEIGAPRRRGLTPRGASTDTPGVPMPAGGPTPVEPADNLAQNPAGLDSQADRPRANQAPRSAGEQPL
jgi:hypothetical protein